MAQTIKLKRSATQGAAPTTSNLALGEVAINTYDGKMYIKKDVGGTESIVEIGGSGANTVSYLEAGMIEYEYTATSNQTTFSGSDSNSATLSYTANSIMVFLNGVLQDDGVDYTATNGTSVVFSSALTANDEVRIVAFTNVTTSAGLNNPTKLDAITTVNAQAAYSLTLNSSAYTPSSQNALIVSLNGITQEPGDSFTISGSTITFSPALVTGDVVDYIVDMGRAVTIGEYSGDLAVGGELEVTGDIIGDLRGATLFKAQAGESLAKGDVVYISGISGNTTVVSKADADDAAKMPAFGLVAAAASSGNPVDIYTFGELSGLDTSSFSEGDELFVSTTAGTLTNSAPTGESSKLQKIAKVTRSDNSAGSVFIMGAGRSNAVPNLDDGDIFIGNASNQAVTASLNTKIEDYLDGGTSTPVFSTINSGNITTTGYIAGPSTFTIDPAAVGDNTGTLVVAGNLQVDGTTTTINSTTMTVDDLNITLASGAANAAAANGAGITVDGASATLTYNGTNDDWNFNKTLNLTGDLNITDDPFPRITLSDSGGTNQKMLLDVSGGYSAVTAWDNTSHGTLDFKSYDGTTTRVNMRIDVTGNVGIKQSSPSTYTGAGARSLVIGNHTGFEGITLATSTTATGNFAFSDGSSGTDQYRGLLRYDHADDSMQFWTSSVRRVTIDSSGNVGIGSTNTSGFKLDVAGTARANNLVFRADTSTPSGDAAIFRPATASLALSTNSTERMRIDSSGNVGIGTDSPSSVLDIASPNVSYRTHFGYGANLDNYFTAGSSGIQVFRSENTERMRIDTSGNVGIGTSTLGSSSKLTVAGSNGTTGLEIIPNDASGEVVLQAYERTGSAFRNLGHTASSFTWDIGGGSEAMRIDASGNVGIGNSSPSAWLSSFSALQIGQAASFWAVDNFPYAYMSANQFYDGASKYIVNAPATWYVQELGSHKWFTAPSGTAGATISFTQAMTLDSSGNLGIGTSSPSTGLELSGAGNTSRIKLINGSDQINLGLWDNTNYRIEGDANRKILITSYHTDGIHLGGSGSSDLVVKGGNVGIGAIPDTTHRVTIAGAGGDRTQPLEVLGTGTSNGFSWLISGMQQNLSAGHRAVIFLGKSESTYNSGGMYYYHAGDGSASNELRWGLFAADDLMRLSTGGNLTLSGSIISSSHYKIQTWVTTITSGASYTVTLPYRQGSGVFTFASDYNLNAAINARWLGHVSGRYGSVALTSTNIHTGPSGSTSYSLSTSYDGSYYQTITYTNNNNANQSVWFAFYGLVAA